MTESPSPLGENIIKIPDNIELKPVSHPAVARRVENLENPTLSKSISVSNGLNKPLWQSMQKNLQTNDDFFCLPPSPNGKQKRRIKRKSSFGVAPQPQHLYHKDQGLPDENGEIPQNDLTSFFKFAKTPLSTTDIADHICKKLQKNLESCLITLKDCLQKTQNLIDQIKNESAKVVNVTSLQINQNRIIAMLPILKLRYQIKQSQTEARVCQGNIRRIAQIQDFADIAKNLIIKFDFKGFRKNYIFTQPATNKYTRIISALDKMISTSSPVEDKDWMRHFENPQSRYYQILTRFKQHLNEMDYSDVDVIIHAITNNKKFYPEIRTFLFNTAWEQIMFPFSDTPQLHFPNVFSRTPKSFNAPYISEPFASMELRVLNSTDWPFRIVSEDLFLILIETDPFNIADFFWESIERIGRIVKKMDPSVTDLDFDQLFSLLLVITFSFGVDEILECFKFSASFEDFETESVHRKFAMQHMEGIVSYILNIKE
ncbi:hypothetical protein TVAG_274730 [Trichomonas vaginalis G3]|uniref:Uncharacterized protein n=1 Tax=Trichomonas vaginalis (strain ATCC PRA-98 / G3) TaxID=412133 RepID=A2EB64_TRIV3|nr:hypothetical protein TVAGG3_0354240 [Trichomonas vaginalis G3]EAY10110.1 hypothetical protein TVAG_274730 [Trichomonas vaginalis G3]KAI5531515.1 hypothetical protein TVAGG3_0354240 [Trichomonas vaginalis G3]|eukprot:XP_001322333.1 hypothetical protein [Trichomonas vaginalis G3]